MDSTENSLAVIILANLKVSARTRRGQKVCSLYAHPQTPIHVANLTSLLRDRASHARLQQRKAQELECPLHCPAWVWWNRKAHLLEPSYLGCGRGGSP